MKDISEEEIKALTTAIKNRYDLDFTCYEMGSFKRRISRALSIFDLENTHELWIKVLREQDFIHTLVNELSVGLTAMFRDPLLWRRLKTLIPELLREKDKITVWHAGCSSGEEVFSFNILLEELGVRDRVKSYASDINRDSLNIAKNGTYNLLKIKDYKKNYAEYNPVKSLEEYYSVIGGAAVMDTELIDEVTFFENNLITEKSDQKFDIIFCRNVLIYFDRIAKLKVLDKFYENLNPSGLLIIGYFDSLVSVIDKSRFELYELEHKIFRRFNKDHKPEMDDVTRKKINLLAHLANVDGNFHRSEKALINSLIRTKGLDPKEFTASKNQSFDDLGEVEDKPELLYLALKLILADGKVHKNEVEYCRELTRYLGFDPSLVERYASESLPAREVFEREVKQFVA